MKKHALFSPSAAERFLNCPASICLSVGIPPAPDSPYAKEGTEAHECLEFLIKNRAKKKSAAAQCLKKYGKEKTTHALFALSEIERRVFGLCEVLSEEKVSLEHIDLEFWGTLDCAIVAPFEKLTVIDYKYGAGIAVDANSPQLIAYALGLAHAHEYLFETVELVIIQPRSPDGKTIKTHFMSMEELKTWNDIFSYATREARRDMSYPRAGKWCKFCPAKVKCPALSTNALADAKLDFAGVPVTPGGITALTPTDIGEALSAFKHVETWIDSVRALAKQKLEKGEKIPGWKLVASRGIRKWLDAKRIEKEARRAFGDAAFSEPELLSPTQLEKIKSKKTDPKTWVKTRCSIVSSGLSLAPDDDRREGKMRAQIDFDVIE